MSPALLIEETDKLRLGAPAVVRLGFVFVVPREELQGGEAGDAVFLSQAFVLLVVRVDIGNDALWKTKLSLDVEFSLSWHLRYPRV